MSAFLDLTSRPAVKVLQCLLAVLAPVGVTVIAVVVLLDAEPVAPWIGLGLLLVLCGVAAFDAAIARVRVDASGLHFRTLLRRWSVPWPDVAELRVHRYPANQFGGEGSGVSVRLRDGRRQSLPLPYSTYEAGDPYFHAELARLHALFRRHGNPASDRLPVITHRTTGYGWATSALLCLLLLGGAGVASALASAAASEQRAWDAAVTCGDETPADEVWECLTRRATVITRTEVERSKAPSVLYFADDPPNFATRLNRVEVPDETAEGFRPGDPVTLTLWRGEIREVVGEHHAWRKDIPEPGVLAAVAAALVLAAGYPAALIVLRHRDRRLPDDEVLPSAGPFAVALAGTGLWLLPLCFLYPTTLLTSPVALGWEAAGALVTVFLLRHAWRASRVRTPGDTAPPPERLPVDGDEPVFLAARFLEHTDYNPRRFGTHIAFGGGPPAVTPHGGPGRFAARRIPVERLTVREVRRVRGEDGDTVPSDWHVAELDDAGHRVRLAAPPASLARILGLLQRS